MVHWKTCSILVTFLGVSSAAAAAPITVNTLNDAIGGGGGGFFVGSHDSSGLNPVHFRAAQAFDTFREFIGVAGFVDLGVFGLGPTGGSDIPQVLFQLSPEHEGEPGEAIAEVLVTVERISGYHRYALDFGAVNLSDATRYWLTASSTNSRGPEGGTIPYWRIGTGWPAGQAGPMGSEANGAWTFFHNQSLAFFLEGTELADPVQNGDIPADGPKRVAEPSTLLLMSMGGLALIRRRQR